MEQRTIDFLKTLKNQNEISEKNYVHLYPSGSKPRIFYGLGKTHKTLENGIPIFRPTLSATDTATYKLAKFSDKLLKPITTNEFLWNIRSHLLKKLKNLILIFLWLVPM